MAWATFIIIISEYVLLGGTVLEVRSELSVMKTKRVLGSSNESQKLWMGSTGLSWKPLCRGAKPPLVMIV